MWKSRAPYPSPSLSLYLFLSHSLAAPAATHMESRWLTSVLAQGLHKSSSTSLLSFLPLSLFLPLSFCLFLAQLMCDKKFALSAGNSQFIGYVI